MAAKYAVLALVAICITQVTAASHIRRSTDASTPMQELMENARTTLDKLGVDLTNWVNSTNIEDVRTLIVNKTQELEARAKSFLDEVNRQIETHRDELSANANRALEETTNQVNEAIKKLKESAPEVMSQASEVRQNFENSFKAAVDTMLEESGKLARAAGEDVGSAHNELAEMSRTAMLNTMGVMQQLHNEMKDAVTRATSS